MRPPQHTIEFAKKIVQAFELNDAKGKGAFEVDGIVIDMPMVKWAKNMLSRVSQL